MYRFHKREVLALTEWLVFEEGKESLTESESTRRRHTVFEHFDEVPLGHHRFIVSLGEEFLLCFESGSLIERIIEFRETISDFTSCDDRLEALDASRIARRFLRKGRDDLWVIHEKYWSRDLLADIFPESICEAFAILTFVSYTKFSEFIFHLIISGSEEIDPRLTFHGFEVVDFRPLSGEIEGMSLRGESSTTVDFFCYTLVELLYELHAIFIVGISPVEFHIREFLEMFRT